MVLVLPTESGGVSYCVGWLGGVGVEHGGTSRYAWQDGEGGKRGMEVKFFYSTWASVVVGRITASSSSD